MVTYDLSITPILKASLDTTEAGVTVTTYNRNTGAAVSQTSSTATQDPASSGRWKWTVAFTSPPTNGLNQYSTKFVGTTYSQVVWIEWDWNEDRSQYNGVVHLDTTGFGTSGTTYPTGTDFQPVSNLTDALTLCTRIKSKTIMLKGALTLDASVSGYTIEGISSPSIDIVTLGGQTALYTNFKFLGITGTAHTTSYSYYYDCWFNNVTYLQGASERCKFSGTITPYGNCITDNGACPDATGVIFNCAATAILGLGRFEGIITVAGLNTGGVVLRSGTGITYLAATNTTGTIYLGGSGKVYNLGIGVGITFTNAVVPFSVWEEMLTDHITSGTAGYMQIVVNEVYNNSNDILTYVGTSGVLLQSSGTITNIDDNVESIKLKTDNLPVDPADESSIESALTTLESNIRGGAGTIQTILTNLLDVSSGVTFIKDIEGGRWKIINNQMIFYKADNSTEVARFNLFRNDVAVTDEPDERQRV